MWFWTRKWKFSPQEMDNVRDQIAAQPETWLREVWAEWQAAEPSDSWVIPKFNRARYHRAFKYAAKLPAAVLAEEIADRAEEMARCTEGGREAYCCPFYCTPHTVTPEPVKRSARE